MLIFCFKTFLVDFKSDLLYRPTNNSQTTFSINIMKKRNNTIHLKLFLFIYIIYKNHLFIFCINLNIKPINALRSSLAISSASLRSLIFSSCRSCSIVNSILLKSNSSSLSFLLVFSLSSRNANIASSAFLFWPRICRERVSYIIHVALLECYLCIRNKHFNTGPTLSSITCFLILFNLLLN